MKQFPLVYVDQVMGLVKFIDSMGGRVDSSRLSEMIDVDLDLLPHVVDAAITLGLLKVENGDLILTESGKKIIYTDTKNFRILMKKINKNVEPFKDILSKQKNNSIELEDLKRILENNGYLNIDDALTVISQWLALIGITIIEK
ncbi:MAG: hypothetical protein C0171_01720 [Caldisphaera sp.]|jgi:hypothetical protein|nr:MAG: hypothetical protein C0201_01010 [Caldisphaera sp.]PMP92002.1 MAG: hypothetical protein C0171_01720 [Caldisphaera sp.]